MPETKVLLQLDDRRDLVTLPATHDPPARIRIDKNTPAMIEVILNNRNQLITRPPATRPDRLPPPGSNRRPVVNSNRLRSRNHDRIKRDRLEPLPVLLTHRTPLNELITDRTHVNEKDHRHRHNHNRARH